MKVNIEITLKDTAGLDFLAHMIENAGLKGTLTTEHPRSSYSWPIILLDGNVVDYARVEAIFLRESSDSDFEMAQSLKAFGIRVHRTKQ